MSRRGIVLSVAVATLAFACVAEAEPSPVKLPAAPSGRLEPGDWVVLEVTDVWKPAKKLTAGMRRPTELSVLELVPKKVEAEIFVDRIVYLRGEIPQDGKNYRGGVALADLRTFGFFDQFLPDPGEPRNVQVKNETRTVAEAKVACTRIDLIVHTEKPQKDDQPFTVWVAKDSKFPYFVACETKRGDDQTITEELLGFGTKDKTLFGLNRDEACAKVRREFAAPKQ